MGGLREFAKSKKKRKNFFLCLFVQNFQHIKENILFYTSRASDPERCTK